MYLNKVALQGIAGLLIVVCACNALAQGAENGTQDPPAAWEDEIRKKLSRRVSFEFVDTPVEEAITFIQTLSKVNIVLDPKVADKGLPTITLRVTDMDLKTALDWICRLSDLTIKLRNRVVYITKADSGHDADTGYTAHRLRDGLPDDVSPQKLKALSAVAAPQARVAFDVDLNLLQIASDEPRDLPRIQTLLKAMDVDTAQWEDEVLKKLSRKVSFEFIDTPLEEAISFLRGLTNINIILDPKAGKNPKPLSLRVTDTDLKTALDLICRQAGLACKPKAHAIFITVGSKADPAFCVCRLRQGLPNGVTEKKLKELIVVGAPKARIAFDPNLKLLIIACDETKDLQRVKTLLKTLGVDTEADRVTKPPAEAPKEPELEVKTETQLEAPQKPVKDF